jgi:hypothetical protein
MGIYLLRRQWSKPGLRYTGIGLVVYALILPVSTFLPASANLSPMAAIPAVCWALAVQHLLQIDRSTSSQLTYALTWVILVLLAMALLLLVIPQTLIHNDGLLFIVGIDLLSLGYCLTLITTRADGETLLPDALRSLTLAIFAAGIFGGQVTGVIVLQGTTPALQMLLLGVITSAVVLTHLGPQVQQIVDRFTLAGFPMHRREQAELRAVAAAVSRQDTQFDWQSLSEADFVRLTRRALTSLNQWDRLAASPLLKLPIIDERLLQQKQPNSTLVRVAELQAVLIEQIERLRPINGGSSGTSEAWRYYNVLYFPYVAKLKLFSLRQDADDLSPETQNVLRWFRAQVPERTLHNWQNKAAQIIARELLEQSRLTLTAHEQERPAAAPKSHLSI